MRTFDEHVAELAATILNTRNLCGNEAEAVRDYFADYGFPVRGISPERDRIQSAALVRAQAEWDACRFRR